MEFAGQDLRNIVLGVLGRHSDGLSKTEARELFKREFIELGNEWPDSLDSPCGSGGLDKPQWVQNLAGVTAAMARQNILDRSVPKDWLKLAAELPDEVLPVVAVANEPPTPPNVDLILGTPGTFGEGAESVYAWAHRSDMRLAELNRDDRYPVKIGYSTQIDPRQRIANTLTQARTALHSGVELLLVYRTPDARKVERAIHSILDVRGHKIEGGLGQEWFRSNPDEVRAVIELVQG